jgi:YidC/Oxa1 family membrane protein insertase
MNTEVQVTSFQKQMMYLGPTVMTAFAAFQPAALQLYFVWSTLLGMVSAVLLKTPAVRRMLGLRLLPSKESNALYSKVVKGQIDLKEFRDPRTGKIRYEAPTATGPSSANKPASASSKPAPAPRHVVRLKQGTTLPPHMRRAAPAKVPQNFADRDLDYDQGTKDLGFADKLNYVARNYKPMFVWRRIKRWYMNDNRPWEVIMAEQKKKKAEHRAKQDELEKQRRLQR